MVGLALLLTRRIRTTVLFIFYTLPRWIPGVVYVVPRAGAWIETIKLSRLVEARKGQGG